MAEIKLELDARNHGGFNLYDEGTKIGEMVVAITGTTLTVYHTEVDQNQGGKGYAGLLLNAMVAHARNNGLKVIALCPYVHAQFKRHPDEYNDIWLKQE